MPGGLRGRFAGRGRRGGNLRFVGCALAWRPGEAREKVSCLVVMDERGSIIANSFAASAEDIAGAIESYGAERRGIVLGVDAPLAVPNERGTRRIERILSKIALPAYSASRRMFNGEPYSEGCSPNWRRSASSTRTTLSRGREARGWSSRWTPRR